MKLLIVFVCLAFVCMIQSAPKSSSKPRELILQDYHDEDEIPIVQDDDEDEMNTSTTTTTTTTTRRSTYFFPTRNRKTLPSRRPWLTQRTSSVRTTTVSEDDIDEENGNEYEGDFRYFRNFGKFVKKIIEHLKKMLRNITAQDIIKAIKQFFNKNNDDD